MNTARTICRLAAAAMLAVLVPSSAPAQQQPPQQVPSPPPAGGAWSTSVPLRATIPDAAAGRNTTTVVPKAAPQQQPQPAAPIPAGIGQLSLTALLTEDGQKIDSGIVWRVFLDSGAADGRPKFITESQVAAPTFRLPPGNYLVNAAFGRAYVTRQLTIRPGQLPPERFVLNAGGLRMAALVGNGEPAPASMMSFEVFSDERDQFGNRTRIVDGVKQGVILRLNSGIYHVVSTYGDANAHVRTDVTVEAGKLTEATVAHAVGKATLKLVMRPGGEALADTQWTIATPQGDVVKESAGALPTHMLAPGNYVVSARSQGRIFKRDFTLQHNDAVQVEVLVQ